MKPRGTYKLAYRAHRSRMFDSNESFVDRIAHGHDRVQRIVDSLRSELAEGHEGQNLSIRQIFEHPRPVYRIELEVPQMRYQRTILLDEDALGELLETEEMRTLLIESAGGA